MGAADGATAVLEPDGESLTQHPVRARVVAETGSGGSAAELRSARFKRATANRAAAVEKLSEGIAQCAALLIAQVRDESLDPRVRQRAACEVLDRMGLKAIDRIEIAGPGEHEQRRAVVPDDVIAAGLAELGLVQVRQLEPAQLEPPKDTKPDD